MEKAMSVEEKIRRAEEIYARRKEGITRPTATVNVGNKKDIKLLKKMIMQVVACTCIYLIVYTIQNSNFIFSQDFMDKAKEILSHDTNFIQIYEDMKQGITNFGVNKEQEITPPQEDGIGGAIEDTNQDDGLVQENTNTEVQEAQNLSQVEQDILTAKNTTSFIKPAEGVVSSRYGQRDGATGSVPKNHTGTDIAANTGTLIKSSTDGEVVLVSSEGDYRRTFKSSNWRSKCNLCTL